jgi:predicted O-methyltransferase YrrM
MNSHFFTLGFRRVIPFLELNQAVEFKGESAQRSNLREHRRVPQNSFGLFNYGIGITTFLVCFVLNNAFAACNLPEVVDYSQARGGCRNDNCGLFEIGALGFNQAPEIFNFMAYLKKRYNLQDAVETGTFQGNTTKALSILFDKVYTIEIIKDNYDISKESLAAVTNVELILGSSGKELGVLLPKLVDRRILFYLDAHWFEDWPILEELAMIAKTHKDNCVIVIDDVKVPGYPSVPYDQYKGQPLSYEYIAAAVKNIFTSHSVHYVIPGDYKKRAKMVLVPEVPVD